MPHQTSDPPGPAPAVADCADCPALAEIAEFARRNPHGNFSLAHARAVTAALLRTAAPLDLKPAVIATPIGHRS